MGDQVLEVHERLPTRAFLAPLAEDEEVEVELAPGNTISIRYKATSQLQADGKREVFFEANGIPRAIEVADTRTGAGGGDGGSPLRRGRPGARRPGRSRVRRGPHGRAPSSR